MKLRVEKSWARPCHGAKVSFGSGVGPVEVWDEKGDVRCVELYAMSCWRNGHTASIGEANA